MASGAGRNRLRQADAQLRRHRRRRTRAAVPTGRQRRGSAARADRSGAGCRRRRRGGRGHGPERRWRGTAHRVKSVPPRLNIHRTPHSVRWPSWRGAPGGYSGSGVTAVTSRPQDQALVVALVVDRAEQPGLLRVPTRSPAAPRPGRCHVAFSSQSCHASGSQGALVVDQVVRGQPDTVLEPVLAPKSRVFSVTPRPRRRCFWTFSVGVLGSSSISSM